MKFGETFTEYLQTNQDRFLEKCCHVEYKRLKKVLKSCRRCRDINNISCADSNGDQENAVTRYCHYNSCPLCDQMFFTELMKEASGVVGFFRQRVGRLLQFHIHNGMQRYFTYLCMCFASPRQATAQECRMLIEYVMMNAVAMRKILKKYDKVHGSANGRKFKSKMIAEHMEILQSPWLIELGAFYMNINQSNDDNNSDGDRNPFSFDLTSEEPIMTLLLPDSVKLEYSLTCAICLESVFHPYALSCGHLFCKSCVCSAASVMIFQGPKVAAPESKCPVCREAGVYLNAVHMMELDLLMKKDCKEYWKERMVTERAEMVKQSKIYWELQTKYMIGY
ncbi:probable E3 ubiquitin-protein ligase bah1-like [Phtheirospermum japonicum]|uniref:RING-type E3 ubiquitin transferase n=1 Tax=Phtheirospermum japonicum TaxID=374723 RepID=A0A830C1A5_9LAMI|nr:probable E3 ubiquitin-protein ligase bah1-like [Phtheirospermum japonicum]